MIIPAKCFFSCQKNATKFCKPNWQGSKGKKKRGDGDAGYEMPDMGFGTYYSYPQSRIYIMIPAKQLRFSIVTPEAGSFHLYC
jgi:hypothetical protein